MFLPERKQFVSSTLFVLRQHISNTVFYTGNVNVAANQKNRKLIKLLVLVIREIFSMCTIHHNLEWIITASIRLGWYWVYLNEYAHGRILVSFVWVWFRIYSLANIYGNEWHHYPLLTPQTQSWSSKFVFSVEGCCVVHTFQCGIIYEYPCSLWCPKIKDFWFRWWRKRWWCPKQMGLEHDEPMSWLCFRD